MAWFKTDAAKIIGTIIGAICTGLAALALSGQLPPWVGSLAGVVTGLLGSLGLVSGGTAGAQPDQAKVAAKQTA
jgi:hypothetical protein